MSLKNLEKIGMKIIQTKNFKKELLDILEFISNNSTQASKKFSENLYNEMQNLGFMPYKFRKSKCFNDENIRDFIFKGYVIPYLIDQENNKIVILAIFKQNLPKFK